MVGGEDEGGAGDGTEELPGAVLTVRLQVVEPGWGGAPAHSHEGLVRAKVREIQSLELGYRGLPHPAQSSLNYCLR